MLGNIVNNKDFILFETRHMLVFHYDKSEQPQSLNQLQHRTCTYVHGSIYHTPLAQKDKFVRPNPEILEVVIVSRAIGMIRYVKYAIRKENIIQ